MGVTGPGLPSGSSLGLFGFEMLANPIFLKDCKAAELKLPPSRANEACAIMSRWYCWSLRFASDSFRVCIACDCRDVAPERSIGGVLLRRTESDVLDRCFSAFLCS